MFIAEKKSNTFFGSDAVKHMAAQIRMLMTGNLETLSEFDQVLVWLQVEQRVM